MRTGRRPVPVYSGKKVMADMAAKGVDVYRVALLAQLHHVTVRRFLSGQVQTIKTAAAIAAALNETPDRYLVRVTEAA
jgi:hypothetical protein